MSNFQKQSWISASNQFYHELLGLNLDPSKRQKFLTDFIRAFERSEDYDLAAQAIFDEIMGSFKAPSKVFKEQWKIGKSGHFFRLRGVVQKQEKGDKVIWQNKLYKVEDVIEDYQDSQNLYTLSRLESKNGVDLQVTLTRVLAYEDELETV